ncbi:hypothetical protein E3N88_32517 [Mikania micrantha]|uniref:Aminotransferase-like plant mobile domain-containing protein n=1 Tax=Mikania micrantha TaxID=192012 RepID=A0A5N6M972_9ASTR|nr:hypothetical protein E3N88_32517 [Mikania micrantha]
MWHAAPSSTKGGAAMRADQKFFSLFNNNPITENVKRYVNIAGFGGLLDCGYQNLDHGLLEALIERWHLETHTFHLPIGEATVTLEDVNVLWGLPIEGGVVSGCEHPSSVANHIVRCHTLLECMQRARCIILYLCGGILFSDSSNNLVSLSILNNLENLTACGQLSWGSAVLAVLYRNLCKATSSNADNIGGPMYILQLWAWCRITTIAPRILHPFDNTRPYGAMWREKLTYKDVISHSLRACRSQLHCLQDGEFKWRPYEKVISFLPEICTNGIRSWQSECYVIYWDVVEFYTPQRVMRQFGMVQHIPSPFPLSINDHMKLHTLTRSGKPERNRMNTHSEYMDGISQTYQQVGGFMQTDSTSNFHNFELLQNTANQVMGMVNEGSRLHYPTHLQTEPVNLGGDDTVPLFQDNNEQDVYTPHASMLPLFNQSQSEDFNYYATQFSPIQTHGFGGISPLPSLDLNLHMSVGEWDDDTLLAHTTLNTEDDDQNQIASRNRNPQRHRRRPGCDLLSFQYKMAKLHGLVFHIEENPGQHVHPPFVQPENPPVSESEDEQLYDMYDSEVLEHDWDYGKHEDDTFNGEFHNPYDDERDSDWSNDDYQWK